MYLCKFVFYPRNKDVTKSKLEYLKKEILLISSPQWTQSPDHANSIKTCDNSI